MEDAFDSYRAGLMAMVERKDAEAIEMEALKLRQELAKHDAVYARLREDGGSPDEARLAESQRARTMLRMVENAAGRLRKTPHGSSPMDWLEDDVDSEEEEMPDAE